MRSTFRVGGAVGLLLLVGTAHAGSLRGRVMIGDEPGWRVAILVDGPGGEAAPQKARIDEQWLSFIPKVQVLAPGSTLRLENHDEHSHTVHGKLGATTLFHLATVPTREGAPQEVTLTRLGVVAVSCEMHDSMHAKVVVTRAPYHAVSDEDGRFVIDGLPPGHYRIRAVWDHGEAPHVDAEPGTEVAQIDVGDGDASVDLRLSPAPAPVAAPVAAPAAKHEPPAPLHAAKARFFDGPSQAWPTGIWVYLLSALALVLGLGAAAANVRLANRRHWSKLAPIAAGCGLAFFAGVLFAFGLHGAVATALGFGLFLGTSIFAAAD